MYVIHSCDWDKSELCIAKRGTQNVTVTVLGKVKSPPRETLERSLGTLHICSLLLIGTLDTII